MRFQGDARFRHAPGQCLASRLRDCRALLNRFAADAPEASASTAPNRTAGCFWSTHARRGAAGKSSSQRAAKVSASRYGVTSPGDLSPALQPPSLLDLGDEPRLARPSSRPWPDTPRSPALVRMAMLYVPVNCILPRVYNS